MTAGIRVRRSLLLAALMGLVLSLGLVFVPPAEAAGSIKASVSAGIAGETVTFGGSLPPKKFRPVVLQRKSGSKWVKVVSGKSTIKGTFTLKTKIRSSTTTYRVYAKAVKFGKKQYAATSTSRKKIATQKQSGALSLLGSAQQGATAKATATFRPARTGRFVVLQRKSGGSWIQVATGSQEANGTVSLTVPTDTAGSFTYRAVTVASNGAGGFTTGSKAITISATPPVDTAPPPVPAGLGATAGNAAVDLTWSAVSAADLAGYNVYRATSSGGPWTKLTGSPTSGPSYDATALTNGTTYWFAVASIDTTGNESAKSLSISAAPEDEGTPSDTAPPPVPAGLGATAGNAAVDLTWSAVSAADLAGYNIYRATSSGGPWTKLTGSPITGTSYGATALTIGTPYHFSVTSIDTAGNESAKSASVTSTPADTSPPPVPGGVSATSGDAEAEVSWSTVSAADLAGYNVYRATSVGGPWTKLTGSPIDATSYDETGLANGTAYYFTVTSVDTLGNESAKSTPATATPAGAAQSVVSHCGTIAANETWSDASIHRLTCAVTVNSGVTLTVEPGAIVKANGGGLNLKVTGSLDAVGTEGAPIVFTLWTDDTAGGDSNGDGAATTPSAGDWGGIEASGIGSSSDRSVDLDYTRVAYARYGLYSGNQGGQVEVTNSSFVSSYYNGIFSYSSTGWVIKNNTFTASTGSSAGPAIELSSTVLDLSKLTGNVGSGNAHNYAELSGTLGANATWPTTGLSFQIPDGLTVAAGVTLTLPAGTTLGVRGNNTIKVNGSLVSQGTSGNQVRLTSWYDPVLKDVTASTTWPSTTPSAGDWGGVSVAGSGEAQLDAVSIAFASTAVSTSEGSATWFHGRVVDSHAGLNADGYVDATNTDWGDSSGPSPYGSGASVSGSGAIVIPWVGYTLPAEATVPENPATVPGNWAPVKEHWDAADDACRDVLFVGVRGSGEEYKDNQGAWIYQGYGRMVRDVRNTFRSSLPTDVSVRQYALDYPARSVPSLLDDLKLYRDSLLYGVEPVPTMYLTGASAGVDRLVAVLQDSLSRCGGSERWVLAGYSQGAMVVHEAITRLGNSDPLAGAVLVADPDRDQRDIPVAQMGSAMSNDFYGIATVMRNFGWADDLGAHPLEPFTDQEKDRVIDVCVARDPICNGAAIVDGSVLDPMDLIKKTASNVSIHTAYGTDDSIIGPQQFEYIGDNLSDSYLSLTGRSRATLEPPAVEVGVQGSADLSTLPGMPDDYVFLEWSTSAIPGAADLDWTLSASGQFTYGSDSPGVYSLMVSARVPGNLPVYFDVRVNISSP